MADLVLFHVNLFKSKIVFACMNIMGNYIIKRIIAVKCLVDVSLYPSLFTTKIEAFIYPPVIFIKLLNIKCSQKTLFASAVQCKECGSSQFRGSTASDKE